MNTVSGLYACFLAQGFRQSEVPAAFLPGDQIPEANRDSIERYFHSERSSFMPGLAGIDDKPRHPRGDSFDDGIERNLRVFAFLQILQVAILAPSSIAEIRLRPADEPQSALL